MAYVLGVDIGTSTTAAAVLRSDGGAEVPLPFQLGTQRSAVPSVAFVPEDGRIVVGEAAERRGRAAPERLVRAFKSRIGDEVPIVVGDLSLAAEELFAAMARWVVDQVEEREGAAPDAVAVTHPAAWGVYKLELVRSALRAVGLDDVLLVSEPEAAARHYAGLERVAEGAALAVYDLGGGTFDVAIVLTGSGKRFSVLGRPDGIEQLGGRDFDDAVVGHVTAVLRDRLESLDQEDEEVLFALGRLRSDCVEAKEALSFDAEVAIPVMLPGVHTQVRLVRAEFEEMIEEPIRDTIARLVDATESAGLEIEDLSTILLVGGSSRIPLVAELVSEELGRPIAVDTDPKASTSLGAAAAAAAALRPAVPARAPAEDREVELATLPYVPHPPRFGAGVAAFAAGGDVRSLRTRAVLAAAAAVAAILVFAGPASPTAVGTDPFASDAARADDNGPAAAAAAAPAPSSGSQPAPPDGQQVAAPQDSTLDLVTSPDDGPSVVYTPVSLTKPAPSGGSPATGSGPSAPTQAGTGTGTTPDPVNPGTGTPGGTTTDPGTGTGTGTTDPGTGTTDPGTGTTDPGTGTTDPGTGTTDPGTGTTDPGTGTTDPGTGTGTGGTTDPGTGGTDPGTGGTDPGTGTTDPGTGTTDPGGSAPETGSTDTTTTDAAGDGDATGAAQADGGTDPAPPAG